eukprot:UC1_evm1s616
MAAAVYSPELTKWLVRLSQIAYDDINAVSDWSCYVCKKKEGDDAITGFRLARTNPTFRDVRSDIQFYGGYLAQADANVIAFRGTPGLLTVDWLTNLDVKLDPLDFLPHAVSAEIQVHSGYQNIIKDAKVSQALLALARELQASHPRASLVITGHSLGGALAGMAAMLIQAHLDIEPRVVAFGTPRTGNEAWARLVRAKLPSATRVTSYADPVARMPTR